MTDTPPRPRRSWVPLVVGILVAMVVVGLALFGAGVFWVTRHVHSTDATAATAADTFARARQSVGNRPPVIGLENERPVLRPMADAHPGAITALHVLAYDRARGRIVRVDIPGWLLHLLPRRTVTISDLHGLSRVRDRITLEDLERYGPGLLVDTTTPDGAQVLVWTE